MGFILLLITSILVCYKWGDWRGWKLYYSTILYFIIGNLTCTIILYDKPLWEYNIVFVHRIFADFLVMGIIFPCTVILYLTYFPKRLTRQGLYIAAWVLLYTSVEWIGSAFGSFIYHDGWNILWSALFNCIMFILIYMHYKKPLWVWPVSILLAILVSFVFQIPIKILK